MDRYARPKKYVSGHNTPRKYDDPTQFKREWNHRNKSKRRKYKAEYHRSRKKKLVAIRGNKCEFCGYKYNGKNAAVFHFHHLRGKKSFNIGNQLVNYAWKEILRELRKCVMLCANCHEMQHTAEF